MKLPYVMAIAKPKPAVVADDKEVDEELKQNKMLSNSSNASGSSEGGMSPVINSQMVLKMGEEQKEQLRAFREKRRKDGYKFRIKVN